MRTLRDLFYELPNVDVRHGGSCAVATRGAVCGSEGRNFSFYYDTNKLISQPASLNNNADYLC
jgi:hypothetical protein